MFKKSRIKIVASIMFILVLLHIGTLGVIYITSYMDVYQKNQGMLERYAEEYIPGGIPGVEKPPPGKMPPEPSIQITGSIFLPSIPLPSIIVVMLSVWIKGRIPCIQTNT